MDCTIFNLQPLFKFCIIILTYYSLCFLFMEVIYVYKQWFCVPIHGCIDWKYELSMALKHTRTHIRTHARTRAQAVLYTEPVSLSPTLTPDCRLYSVAPHIPAVKKMKIALREWKSRGGSLGWIGAGWGLSEHWQPVLYGEVRRTGGGERVCGWDMQGFRWVFTVCLWHLQQTVVFWHKLSWEINQHSYTNVF